MNKIMFHKRWGIQMVAAMTAVIIMTACVDDWDNHANGGGDIIRLVHSKHLDYMDSRTVSSNREEYIPLTIVKEDSLFVRTRQDEWQVDWKQKKNSASRAIKQEGDYEGFYMNAYAMDGQKEAVMVHQRVEVNDKSMDYSPVCRWPGDREVCFYAWAARSAEGPYALQTPVWSVTNDAEGNPICSAQFSYSIPAYASQEGIYNDAYVQPDIILGMAPSKTHEDNPVVMNFQHALAAVHFKISSVPEGTTISRVEIIGVAGGGTCTFTGSSEAGAMQIGWKTDGTSRSFNQSFTWTDEGEMALTDNNTTFAMIPQTLGADAKVRVYFTVGEADYVSIASLNGKTWKPGKKYTYTITTREYAEVQFGEEEEEEVTEKMEEVVVQNTGLVKVYIRAAVVGYWQNDEGVILMPWDIEDENVGVVTWGEGWTDAWGKNQKAADGWYYHKRAVDIGCYTDKPLIESYVLTANPPMMDAHLEFNVIVQIVEENNVEEEWNVTVVDGQIVVI